MNEGNSYILLYMSIAVALGFIMGLGVGAGVHSRYCVLAISTSYDLPASLPSSSYSLPS